MCKHSTVRRLVSIVAILVSVGLTLPEAAAQKQYKEAFEKAYPALAAQIKEADCNICHYGKSKRNLNDYGKAMGEALGAKKVKDEDKIAEALKKAGEAKDADGKTFASVIEGGALPIK